ncbi:MAG TPA: hypothetical protein VE891_01485 [Allosphingosinicella sp.]|nr:hypothetical protein [Allosphingosinicella sp.]
MKIIDFVRSSSALALMAVPATMAGAQSVFDPAPIISAFNETCRRGFPNLGTIGRHAESQGWIRRSARLIAERSDPKLRTVAMPDFFGKGDMMLMLDSPNALTSRTSCGIAVSGQKTLDIGAFAEAVSVALDGAQPTLTKKRGLEQATWQVKSGMVVQASVMKSGRIRTLNLVVQTS